MRFFILFASVFSFAAAAAVGTASRPYQGTLTQPQANDIVNALISVLQNKNYNGQPSAVTYKKVIAANYKEHSDSILSLISKNSTLGGPGLVTDDREAWYKDRIAHPVTDIRTNKVYVANGNVIVWFWAFNGIGHSVYPVTGFNLLYIDCDKKIYQANIEFNSIAFGVDSTQINQYCPTRSTARDLTLEETADGEEY